MRLQPQPATSETLKQAEALNRKLAKGFQKTLQNKQAEETASRLPSPVLMPGNE